MKYKMQGSRTFSQSTFSERNNFETDAPIDRWL